jgi:predicted MPP superfamily phosphohydrolase
VLEQINGFERIQQARQQVKSCLYTHRDCSFCFMRLLHTSDWHLGQHFMGKTRQAEHEALIQWLLQQVQQHALDVVLIAGDVFDTGAPPSYARELYNQLILQLRCR